MDDRIFHKECLALVEAGYLVHLVAVHDRDEVIRGVRIHVLGPVANRMVRMLFRPWQIFWKILSLRPRPFLCHLHDPELLPMGVALQLAGFKVIFDVHENIAAQILSKPYLPKRLRGFCARGYRILEGVLTSRMATVHVLDSIARHYPFPKVVVRNLPKLDVPVGDGRRVGGPPESFTPGALLRIAAP